MNQEGYAFVRLDENKIVCIWVYVGIEMNIWAAMIDTPLLCRLQSTHSFIHSSLIVLQAHQPLEPIWGSNLKLGSQSNRLQDRISNIHPNLAT